MMPLDLYLTKESTEDTEKTGPTMQSQTWQSSHLSTRDFRLFVISCGI